MFFIHNNDPHVFKRSEDGGPSTHGDLHFTLPDPSPLIITFSPSKLAVKEAEVFSKTILKSREELRGQGDLRDEDDCLPPLI
jgi:hypothetical protein